MSNSYIEDPKASADFWEGFDQSSSSASYYWLLRCTLTLFLILGVFLARRYQLSLMKQTQSELNSELYTVGGTEESTNITEESFQTLQNRPGRRRVGSPRGPARSSSDEGDANQAEEECLDDSEYQSAERACRITRELIQQREALEALLAQPVIRTPRKAGKERELAARISENFEQLNGLWNANKETSEELKTLVRLIAQRLTDIPNELNNDRVAASQCMSICCNAILKYDGLYVLDAIRNIDVDLANDCQGIIETAVPFIWAT